MRISFITKILILSALVFIAAHQVLAYEIDIPEQLLDISLTINDRVINSIDELSANAIFVSFGKEPAMVDLTFIILDSAGKEVYKEKDNIIVETEFILNKKFEGIGLETGKYTLVLETLYDVSIKDEFKQKFEIVEGEIGMVFGTLQFWIFIAILVVISVWGFHGALSFMKTKININKLTFNTIRTIEDSRTINEIMAINRFVILAASFLFIYLTWLLNIIRFDPLIVYLYVLPGIAVANGVWLWYCRTRPINQFYFMPQVLIDIGLILSGVYFSGGLYSDFLFLPLVVLSLAAFVSWRLSFTAFVLSFGVYFFLFFYQMWGLSFHEILQSLGGLQGMKLIRILIFAFMGILISFVISYFVREIKRRNEEIENIKKEAYSKTVRALCDPLTAIRWILDELDNKEFIVRNREFAKNIETLRQFKEKILVVVKKSLVAVDNDFFTDEKLQELKTK